MKRIAAYIRVSTEEQKNHGLSVEAQTHELTEWAKTNKYKIVDFYIDAGFSARKKAHTRPELQRMLNDIRAGKIDTVVFTKLDRWFRNVQEYYKVQEVLDDANVSWKAINEDYETETASGRFKVNIMLAVAQDESDRDSERIKAVMRRKRQKGELLSGSVPYGYKKVGLQVEFDPDAKPIVERFFELMLSERSVSFVLKQLEAETGKRISRPLAYRMRTFESYMGNYHGLKIPAYITAEQHQTILENIHDAPKMTPTGRTYIFSGMVRCAECGARMEGHAQQRKHVNSVYYSCRRHNYNGECTNKVCMVEWKIEQYAIDNLESILCDEQFHGETEMQIRNQTYEKDIAAINRKISRLKDLYVNELIELDEYRKDYLSLTAELETLQEEQTKIIQFKRRDPVNLPHDWKNVYKDLDAKAKSEFWYSILSSINIDSNRKITLITK